MNTGCIKTGCVVHFSDYGQTISADVFRVGTALVISTHAEQVSYDHTSEESRSPDLTVASNSGREEFWRTDKGVFAIPENECCLWHINPHP